MNSKNELFFDEHCPACILKGNAVLLHLNKGDIFECPECHLMIALASGSRAVLISRRGTGNFKELANQQYSSKGITGRLLVKEDPKSFYDPDKFNSFKHEAELTELISQITKIDDCC